MFLIFLVETKKLKSLSSYITSRIATWIDEYEGTLFRYLDHLEISSGKHKETYRTMEIHKIIIKDHILDMENM